MMKQLVLVLMVMGSSVHTVEAAYELVWQDEFNGTSIDLTKWTHEVNAQGGGNNELQFYTARSQNSFVSGGWLTLRAIKEQYTAQDPTDGQTKTRGYTSARLNTRFKGDWLYGRMEVRAKMPRGQGLWPAIWMLPTDYKYGGWAASGEIDILELRGENPTEAVFSIHYGGPYPDNVYSSGSATLVDLSLDFHDYAVEWEPNQIRWYVDGELKQTRTSWYSTGGPYPAPFNERFHLLLNVAVGGNFLQNPPANANYFPQQMLVDYVRVYQQGGQEPYGELPIELPGRLQVEEYDQGGQGFGYNDTTIANQGGAFRTTEAVDLEVANDAGGGYNLGYVVPGEWLEFSVNSLETNYNVSARVASAVQGGTATLLLTPNVEGAESTSVSLLIPGTGGWQSWQTVQVGAVAIQPGSTTARLEITSGEFNLNWIDFMGVPVEPEPDEVTQWRVY